MKGKLLLILVFLNAIYISNVYAIPVTISANDYPTPTDISNVFPNVSLSQVVTTAGSKSLNYTQLPDTGTVSYGAGPMNYLVDVACVGNLVNIFDADMPAYMSEPCGFSSSSSHPFTYFAFTAFSLSGEVPQIFMLDSSNNLLSEPTITGSTLVNFPSGCIDCPLPGYTEFTFAANLANQSVSRILIGDGSGTFIDSMTLDTATVPEPASLYLLGIGLIGLGTLRKTKLRLPVRSGQVL